MVVSDLAANNIITFPKMQQSNTLAYFAVMPKSDLTFLIIDNLSVKLSARLKGAKSFGQLAVMSTFLKTTHY